MHHHALDATRFPTTRGRLALVAAAALFLLLAACGGGGGGGDGGVTAPPVGPGAPVTPVAPTPAPITITSAPANQSVSDGQSARLQVVATSSVPLTYQWQRDGTTIVGANDAAYVTPVLTLADSGARFAVLVSNGSASDLTAVATVTVQPLAPRLTEQPSSLTVAAGGPASFAVRAVGSLPLSYQWQRDGVDIAGAQAATYTLPAAGAADGGARYRVLVRNAAGVATSEAATLTLAASTAVPLPTPLEKRVMVAAGQRVVISTQVAGALPFSYQWLRNGQPIAGAAGSSNSALVQFTTAAQTAADDGTSYALAVNNADGASTSTTTTLSIVDVPRVAAGGAHSLALSADGRTLWAWGDNRQGQLGLGDTSSRGLPTVVGGLPTLQAIAAGADHTLALAADGSVWAWGSNRAGALGDGSLNGRALPQRVNGVGGVIAIAAGNGRSFALRADGSLLGWGENSSGALGLGTTVNMLVPAPVGRNIADFDSIVSVAAGARHTLALRSDGEVFSFGEVAVPLADGVTMHPSPVLLNGLHAVAGLAAGDGYSLALDIGGRLWAWGRNGSGQLGLGHTVASATPTLIGQGTLPSKGLAAGDDFALALPVNGALQAWGAADDGQLGSGTGTAPRPQPGALAAVPGALRSIVAGGSHSLAVQVDGSVHAWGANAAGQLGIGSSELRRTEPVQVPGLNLN
ncbi:MAG: hypothetical protein Q7U73_15410 [Rubrivivax sp.]|nr:hypothetical protein [Rubrivivax sp.]